MFGMLTKTIQGSEMNSLKQETAANINIKTKRELIKLRDKLLKKNDDLILQLKRKLVEKCVNSHLKTFERICY